MEKNNGNNAPFKAEDVNWEELAGIGILKDELEMSGELETLLSGKKTKVMSLSLVLLGVDVVMDATLQLIRKDGEPLMEILGVKPVATPPLFPPNRKPPSKGQPAVPRHPWRSRGTALILQKNEDESNHSRKTECGNGYSPCGRGYRKDGRLLYRQRIHGDLGSGAPRATCPARYVWLYEDNRR